MDGEDCSAWKKFLVDYAQASRSVAEFDRTLFVTVLEGEPPADPPPEDVTLKCFDWRGVIDGTDLLLAAHERLRSRDAEPVMRSLLATTVARVASWDPDVTERLLDEGCDAILDPPPWRPWKIRRGTFDVASGARRRPCFSRQSIAGGGISSWIIERCSRNTWSARAVSWTRWTSTSESSPAWFRVSPALAPRSRARVVPPKPAGSRLIHVDWLSSVRRTGRPSKAGGHAP